MGFSIRHRCLSVDRRLMSWRSVLVVVIAAIWVGACGGSTDFNTVVSPRRSVGVEPSKDGAGLDSCIQPAPPGASEQAKAYLSAANAAYPKWIAETQTLNERGAMYSIDDLQLQ